MDGTGPTRAGSVCCRRGEGVSLVPAPIRRSASWGFGSSTTAARSARVKQEDDAGTDRETDRSHRAMEDASIRRLIPAANYPSCCCLSQYCWLGRFRRKQSNPEPNMRRDSHQRFATATSLCAWFIPILVSRLRRSSQRRRLCDSVACAVCAGLPAQELNFALSPGVSRNEPLMCRTLCVLSAVCEEEQCGGIAMAQLLF